MTQDRALERRERILDAALEIFAAKGFSDTGVDEIAGASETSKGGVYFHFPGKHAIFLALLERSASRLKRKIEGVLSAETVPERRADAALRTVVDVFSGHRALARLLMVEALGAGHEFHTRMLEIRAEFASIVSDELKAAARQGVIPPLDSEVAGRAWFGAVNEVVTNWVLGDHPGDLQAAYAALAPLLKRSVGFGDPE